MKKIPFLSLILVLMISSSVQAGEWLYSFVVWDGKEYEVKEEERIEESKIGKKIGEVKTQPYSDMRSSAMRYSGDASNIYPVGTPYYEIKGVSTSNAIAVKVDNVWIRADYVQVAPQHSLDTVTEIKTKTLNIVPFVFIGLILIGFIYLAIKKSKRRNTFK